MSEHLEDPMPTLEQNEKILKYAAEVRQFEIGLFWQRSLIFWGFIAAVYLAYANLSKDGNIDIRLAIACFGFVCSVAWTLVNRGSKYWQEAWEQKVQDVERSVLGFPLFSDEKRTMKKGCWSAKRYSVSRLAIALSDFTVLVWIVLAVKAMPDIDWGYSGHLWMIMPVVSVAYAAAMVCCCRSGTGI